tara:strand:- start:450 stop:650 length:201 start_codon:yes stop_codon:yes gene_type:complete
MNKLESLTAQAESKRLEYVIQEQLYINNYYYDHVVAMIAFEHMNKLKTSLGAIRAEIAGLEVLAKL